MKTNNTINWKLRLQNKATLISLISVTLAFVYSVLGLFGIVPPITQDELQQALVMLVQLLVLVGIVVDPTTEGIGDSEQALEYEEPKKSE